VIHTSSLYDTQLHEAWLTIGIYDGVHLGHRALITRLVEGAHNVGLPAVLLTFHPHPAVVLGSSKEFKCLTTPDERAALLEPLGVDVVITQPFDRAFANQTADEFMQRLKQTLGLQHLVIGYDTALGRDRVGDASYLARLGETLGYTIEVVKPVRSGESIISSNAIRTLVRAGAVEQAARLLGSLYAISGAVVHGDGRGRHINLPTANIDYPEDKVMPANGIYATWAWVQGERLRGATNIGINPTFTPDKQVSSLETHMLDFDRDLYGQQVKLEFVARLREERKFQSVQELLEQINRDIEQTRNILK
jgi:riboflavin kinase/FMN adenylyltransferase